MNKVSWLETAVFYNIYPQSFYDSNGDGIGDLRGVTEKLDYIKDMGFTAIWLNPIYESPFRDAGYDVTDFYQIAPRYGTMEDFQELCRIAHQKGLKVCVDLVAGHTSLECEWFQKSALPEKNEYTNRYVWTDDWLKCPPGAFINGYSSRNGCYMSNFFYSQPALNYGYARVDDPEWQLPMDHPDCRAMKEELIHIMEYWIAAGCDGFRVDMAASLVKNDEDFQGITAFWQEIRQMFDEKYPECVLIAEWSDPKVAIPAGFHIDFMIHSVRKTYTSLFRAEKGRSVNVDFLGNTFFDRAGKGDIEEFLEGYLEAYNVARGKGYISIPTGNHDLPRISYLREKRDMEIAYAFVLTLPGVPFVYYGDEIGMRNQGELPSKEGGFNRTGARTPMQWNRGKNLGFSFAEAEKLYLPVDTEEGAPTVEEQWTDESSLLHCMRRLIALRKSSKALSADGDITFLNRENRGYPLVYQRSCNEENYYIFINPTGEKSEYKLDIKGEIQYQNDEIVCKNGIWHLPPVSVAIVKAI